MNESLQLQHAEFAEVSEYAREDPEWNVGKRGSLEKEPETWAVAVQILNPRLESMHGNNISCFAKSAR